MKDWTVTIGDVTLFVPPTSIRCLTQTKSERMPVVRAKGSMAKSPTKNQRIIEMDLYFNDDKGINGFEYHTNTHPDNTGKDITYWMNGLRALYAQFRIAPFLPIENNYINVVLGIDAVTMLNFVCETVPSFPRLIKATVQMSEFEYRIYMPEIPWDPGDDDDNVVRNYFSRQINYPLFRYYYQRLIRNGQNLKNTDFLDKKFIENTFGNKTCLIPAKFVNPYMKFYIPNRDQLEKAKKAKIARLTRPNTVRDITRTELNFCEEMAKIKNELDYINSQGPLDDINEYLSSSDMDGYVLTTNESDAPVIMKKEMPSEDKKKWKNVTGYIATTIDEDKTKKLCSLIQNAGAIYKDNLAMLKSETGNELLGLSPKTCYTYSWNGETKGDGKVSYNLDENVNFPDISDDSLNSLRTLSTTGNNKDSDPSAEGIFKDRTVNLKISFELPDDTYKTNGNIAI